MRTTVYKELMEMLDAAVNNGYDDEMTEMSPEEILEDVIDLTGTRSFDDVPNEEVHEAIRKWQERQE